MRNSGPYATGASEHQLRIKDHQAQVRWHRQIRRGHFELYPYSGQHYKAFAGPMDDLRSGIVWVCFVPLFETYLDRGILTIHALLGAPLRLWLVLPRDADWSSSIQVVLCCCWSDQSFSYLLPSACPALNETRIVITRITLGRSQ